MLEGLPYIARALSKRTFILVVLVTLSIAFMFAEVFLTVNGLYESLREVIVTERERVVTLSSASAFTPFTGLIRGDLAEKAERVKGVEGVLSEVVLPVLVNGSIAILRGVEVADFEEVIGVRLVSGGWLNDSCLTCAWVGVEAAEVLGVEVGDLLVVQPLFTARPFEVRVVGVVRCGKPYDGEVIVPLVLARVVRGAGPGAVSIVRVKISPGTSPEDLYSELEVEPASRKALPTYIVEKVVAGLSYAPGKTALGSPREITDMYLSRLGLSYDTLLALSMVVLALLSYGSYVLGMTVVAMNRNTLAVLREIGVSKRSLALRLAVILIPLEVLSVLLGFLVAAYVVSVRKVVFLSYTAEPTLTPTGIIASCLAFSLLLVAGILSERVE